jgi:hypothetical protein
MDCTLNLALLLTSDKNYTAKVFLLQSETKIRHMSQLWVNFWNEINVQLSKSLALNTSHKIKPLTALWSKILELKSCLAEPGPTLQKQILYSVLCSEILELNSCLAKQGPDPRSAPQNKCFTLPSEVKSWN